MGETAFCQSTARPPKVKIYNAIVRLTTQKQKVVGVLRAVDDSTVHLKVSAGSLRINARVIRSITIKRKGNVGRGAFGGAMGGLFIGGLIGFSSGDDEPCAWCFTYTAEEKALAGAVLGGGIGALIGMVFGSSRKEYVAIDGVPAVFKAHEDLLRTYTLPSDYVGY